MGDDLLRLLIHKAHCFEAAIRYVRELANGPLTPVVCPRGYSLTNVAIRLHPPALSP